MNFKKIFYGGDYNPDQWPEEVWQEDARLMQEAGVNLVSLGIFSWSKLEPQSGKFDFAWLDQLMDLLYSHGVCVNLATPTAAPPAWMIKQHPEILPVTAEGVTLWHGSRRHYCPHNPDYHFYAARIAQTLADHYKDHPALAMWHVDNEYSCHFSECYCPHSAAAFRVWLQERYGSISGLNSAWGTAFWSQSYGDWEEIQPPLAAPTFKNPTQELDWVRFSSDSWLSCFDEQKSILKKITPNIPVTTNFMSFHKGVDYFKFAAHEDVVSNDSYPDTGEPDWTATAGMACDLIRSVGKGEPWILMEQAPSQVNWRYQNVNKRPGVMRLGSMQAVARGANGIMFFQWRQSKAGVEKHHSGMIPHAGTDSRIWREVKALGNELPRLNGLLASKVESQAAIIMDWSNWWALELESKPSNDLKLIKNIAAFYQPLFEKNITVDFVSPRADLTKYKLVLAPNLYLVDDPSVKNINEYVARGGTLLMTFFSGIVDENEQIRLGGYPASFRKMLGMVVEEYAPYPLGVKTTIATAEGKHFENQLWADVIHLEGAESIAKFEEDYYAGQAAITRHEFGKGLGYYLGTELEPAGISWLLERICKESGIQPVLSGMPASVEVLKRASETKEWYFLLNHSGAPVQVDWRGGGFDLIQGRQVDAVIALDAYGAAVIEKEKP